MPPEISPAGQGFTTPPFPDVVGRFGAGKVILRSASPGTGIIAGGPMRALFESLGIKDVVAKSTGTSNPHNMLKATFNAFKRSESPKSVAAKRSKKISEVVNLRHAVRDGFFMQICIKEIFLLIIVAKLYL